MRLRVTVFGTLGTLATLVGTALLVAPEQVRQIAAVDRFVVATTTVPQAGLVVLTGTLACGYVLFAARSRTTPESEETADDAQRRFEAVRERPPEAVTAERQTLTAADVDGELENAVSGAEDELLEVRETLRTLVAQENENDRGETIEDGSWTADPVAAAFLAGPAGPTMPISSRLRLWLAPERERRRRIERTLTAIEERAGQS